MDKKTVYFVAAILAAAIIIEFLRRRQAAIAAASVVVQVAESDEENAFYAPYYYPSAGNYPQSAGFNSDVTVNMNLSPISVLAQQYMPTFGFVGMVGVGAS